jgi:hypothetical protein
LHRRSLLQPICVAVFSLAASGCDFDSTLATPYSSSTDSYARPVFYGSTPSYNERPYRERSYVSPRGDMVFTKPRETTIVHRDGHITVIQRDRDGTRTIVGSDGVRVVPPGSGRRWRR